MTRIVGLGERCCGCAACAAICPVSCISMKADDLGFPYPSVDLDRCVSCLRCEDVCPALSSNVAAGAGHALWAKAADRELLLESSSGGVFGLLAKQVFNDGGIVYGAAFTQSFDAVRHVRVGDPSCLNELLRSKYVQSNLTIDLYRSMREDLAAGNRVLVSGTPCQIKGVKRYLELMKAPVGNLLLAEIICHGVPSPMLWRQWIRLRSEVAQKRIISVNFRSKRIDWENYSVEYSFEDGTTESSLHEDDWFMKAFLCNASIRSSCFACPAKCSSGSDVTLGDYWGVDRTLPSLDRSDGVSAVLTNTDKGQQALNDLQFVIESGPASFADIAAGNSALVRSVEPYAKRTAFLDDARRASDMSVLVKRWDFRRGALERIVAKIKKTVAKNQKTL